MHGHVFLGTSPFLSGSIFGVLLASLIAASIPSLEEPIKEKIPPRAEATDFLQLQATQMRYRVLLSWVSPTPALSHYFCIERAINDEPFQLLSRIPATQRDHRGPYYRWVDCAPAHACRVHYRLRHVHWDGEVSYSHVVAVQDFP